MKKFLISLMIAVLAVPLFAQSGNKYVDFLRNNGFKAEKLSISFLEDGKYSMLAMKVNDYNMCGEYVVTGNKVTIYPYEPKGTGYFYKELPIDDQTIKLPATFEICPEEEDLFHYGCLKSGKAKLWCARNEGTNKICTYEGYNVIKYPVGDKRKCVFVQENTKMRSAPTLKSDTVKLDYWRIDDMPMISDRNVVYAGEMCSVFGVSDFEETINGVKARWYLILESNNIDDELYEDKIVWIFGGWVKEINFKDKDVYAEQSKKMLKKSLPRE